MRIRSSRARQRGFTLLEMAVVVAIAGILAAAAYFIPRSALRNANLGSATYDLSLQLSGLRDAAMATGQDHLLVVVNGPGNASACGTFSTAQCTRWFVLKNPTAAWVIDGFDPSAPATSADFVSSEVMPRGIALTTDTVSAPTPFTAVELDPDLTTSCGGNTCFAIRFTQRGEVRGEFRSSVTSVAKSGYLFALGTDLASGGSDRKATLVSFPTGIVKTFSF